MNETDMRSPCLRHLLPAPHSAGKWRFYQDIRVRCQTCVRPGSDPDQTLASLSKQKHPRDRGRWLRLDQGVGEALSDGLGDRADGTDGVGRGLGGGVRGLVRLVERDARRQAVLLDDRLEAGRRSGGGHLRRAGGGAVELLERDDADVGGRGVLGNGLHGVLRVIGIVPIAAY